ncbi:MAG: DUF4296 domain-containing protein [Flavobacteriales bacterium]|nr:DUF4296 domain-containing protein [Flavobacteriales bacterium]
MFHNKIIVVFLVIVTCFSCKEEQIDKDIIPPSKMVEILSDMELAKATIIFQEADKKIKNEFFFNVIFKNHNTNKEKFEKSLHYYSQKPKEMEQIYNQVITLLSQKQASSVK